MLHDLVQKCSSRLALGSIYHLLMARILVGSIIRGGGKMAINRFFAFILVTLFTSPCMARVDADIDSTNALAELQAAQAAYSLAMEQLHIAERNLERATAHAVALGAIQAPEQPASSAPAAEPKPAPAAPPPVEVKKKEKGPSFWTGWKRSVRFGLNSSSGNTENTNLNLQFHTKRKSKKYLTKFDSEYRFATRNGVDSQNRLEIDFRHEWLAPEGHKVGWWTTASFELDEFQDWDYRASAHAGISYQFIKNEKTKFKGRTGFGGSQTFGGTEDDFRPEALVTGLDLTHRFNEVMNIEAGTEYFVDVSQVSRDRLNNHVKLNILLDKESNMNLQFKLTHKFDSEPGGVKDNNDIYFDITVGWQF
jgi:putative salt-induced outer membrane protein YdiY